MSRRRASLKLPLHARAAACVARPYDLAGGKIASVASVRCITPTLMPLLLLLLLLILPVLAATLLLAVLPCPCSVVCWS